MKKKFFTKKKVIVIVVIVVILILILRGCASAGAAATAYQEVTAETRDITTYLEFSGNVEAADVKNVFAETTGKVVEVLVEEGDDVKKGDVIARLDTSDLEYNIQIKEASLALSKLQNDYNIKDSQTSVNNLTTQIDEGLNATINNAQKMLLSAQEQYYQAVENYNTAKADLDAEKTTSIVSAKQQLKSAQDSYNKTLYALENPTDMAGNAVEKDYSDEEWEMEMLSVTTALKNAQDNLKTAREQAQKQVDNYYDTMVAAEEALADAERDYETTLLSMNQNVESTKNSAEKVAALASTEISEMELAHLKETLEDYTIYATMDGVITTLNLKEGEYTSNAGIAAVITSFDKMQAAINIDEYDIAQVNEGDEVEIYVNALDSYYNGRISEIARTATAQSDVSFVKATVEFDADEKVCSGFSAEIKLVKLDEKGVVALPVDAIEYDVDNTSYVLMKGEDGTEVKHTVVLGVSDGNYVQILEGVQAGDIVLTKPSLDEYYEMMMEMSMQ